MDITYKQSSYHIFYKGNLQAIIFDYGDCKKHMRGEIEILERSIKDYYIVYGEKIEISK